VLFDTHPHTNLSPTITSVLNLSQWENFHAKKEEKEKAKLNHLRKIQGI
jgi:hypothetical protein